MWCGGGGKSYSCELNETRAFKDNKDNKCLENLFANPPKSVESFVDFCKNALLNSHVGRFFKFFRDGFIGPCTSSSSSSSAIPPKPPQRRHRQQQQRRRRRRRNSSSCRPRTSSGQTSSDEEQHDKHVMFADSLGLDLELIHTIQINNPGATEGGADELDKLITKQSFFNSYNNQNGTSTPVHAITNTNSDKLIIPKFKLSPDRNYEKLIKNGICLNSIEIYNQSSIRGVILTLTKPTNRNPVELSNASNSTGDYFEDVKSSHDDKFKLIDANTTKPSESSSSISISSNDVKKIGMTSMTSSSKSSRTKSNLDIVYIIWSVDDWTSWKYQAAIKNSCRTLRTSNRNTNSNSNNNNNNNNNNTGIIKTHEFFLQNLDLKLQVGQTLQLIICHQTDLVVFKDTNNEECYKFECAIKV